jgi:hypothetical protein
MENTPRDCTLKKASETTSAMMQNQWGPCSFSFAIDASKSAADSKDHEATKTLLFSFAIDASKSAANSKDHETNKDADLSLCYRCLYERRK